jgi:orotate phosphoribosyltransferase
MAAILTILKLKKEELLKLEPEKMKFWLGKREIFHILRELGGLWLYDYEAAQRGKVGYHAQLKSGRCSDGFLNFKEILKYPNLRKILANQLVFLFQSLGLPKPHYLAGIPNSAKELGKEMAEMLGVKAAEIIKDEKGRMQLITPIFSQESLLLIDDVCTRGTGFQEAIETIKRKNKKIVVLPYNFVIFNRGRSDFLYIKKRGIYQIVALVKHQINDWEPTDCPLCKIGSKRIKPKISQENWQKLINSQL